MKANAPEKLYLFEGEPILSARSKKLEGTVIEYISTDAFIERACDWLDGVLYDYIKLKHANVDTFIDVDNKRFIDDFKRTMKEV